MPEAFLNIFDYLDYTFFNTFFKNLNTIFSSVSQLRFAR